MNEILCCDHSNETSLAVLSHGTIYLVLAGEIIEYSKKIKWYFLHTVWVLRSWENGTELESAFKEIMTNESDVVIVNMCDSHNV